MLRSHLFALSCVAVLNVTVADAHITRIEITGTESPTFEGRSFGDVGPYEKLRGRAYGEVDPEDPRNAVITDIELAPRNANGMVEYSMDIYILKPVDLGRGNHKLVIDVNNRGTKRIWQINNSPVMNDPTTAADAGEAFFMERGYTLAWNGWDISATAGDDRLTITVVMNDPTTAADAGEAFFMERGYTLAWNGWDISATAGDDRLTITVPVATNSDGAAITGPSYEYISANNDTTTTYSLAYPAATLDKSQARLTVKRLLNNESTTIAPSDWEYVDDRRIRLLPAGHRLRAESRLRVHVHRKGSARGRTGPGGDARFCHLLAACDRRRSWFCKPPGRGCAAYPGVCSLAAGALLE